MTPKPRPNKRLSPRAKEVLTYLERKGDATAREALLDLDINSGSFTKRISELREAGIPIRSETKFHPITQRRYVRYVYTLHD